MSLKKSEGVISSDPQFVKRCVSDWQQYPLNIWMTALNYKSWHCIIGLFKVFIYVNLHVHLHANYTCTYTQITPALLFKLFELTRALTRALTRNLHVQFSLNFSNLHVHLHMSLHVHLHMNLHRTRALTHEPTRALQFKRFDTRFNGWVLL